MENNNGNSKVRRVLNKEITRIIGIVIAVFTFLALIIVPINNIQKDISNIEENSLQHIQDSLREIAEDKIISDRERTTLMLRVEKISTILDQHLQ